MEEPIKSIDVDEVELGNRAERLLEQYKKIEKKTKFHTARINSKTIVCCKRKENIELYKSKENNPIIYLNN